MPDVNQDNGDPLRELQPRRDFVEPHSGADARVTDASQPRVQLEVSVPAHRERGMRLLNSRKYAA